MSMTYANAETDARTDSRTEPAAFVPRYARPTKSKKAVKTWMILAPIGAVVLLGSAAAMMFNNAGETTPEPMNAAPAMEMAPAAVAVGSTPPASAALTPTGQTMTPPVAETPTSAAQAPVMRQAEAAPRRAQSTSQSTSVTARPTSELSAPRAETPAVLTGPQPYTAPDTVRLNVTPAAPTASTAPAVQTPPPVIVVQPTN